MLTLAELEEIQARLGGSAEGSYHSAPDDVDALLAEVRRLQGELARYKWTRVSEGLPEEGKEIAFVMGQGAARIIVTTTYHAAYPLPKNCVRWMHIPPAEGE